MYRIIIGLILFHVLSMCDTFSDEAGVKVVEYTGPPITEQSVRVKWTATVEGDLVTITFEEDSLIVHQITLFNVPGGKLPISPGYIYKPGQPDEVFLHRGEIAIQDWDVDGVMSGHATGDLKKRNSPVPVGLRLNEFFWVDVRIQQH